MDTSTKLVTATGKIVFHKNLFVPKEGKYSAALVLEESQMSSTEMKKIQQLIEAVANEKWAGNIKKYATPIKMAKESDYEEGEYEYLYGKYIINAKANAEIGGMENKIDVVSTTVMPNGQFEKIYSPNEVVAGDYARFVVGAYAWEFQKRYGVSLNLYSVQKIKSGTPFYKRQENSKLFDGAEIPTDLPDAVESTTDFANQDF